MSTQEVTVSAYRDIKVQVTADDFANGDFSSPSNCPGFRAVKRRIPDLTCWGVMTGYTASLVSAIKVIAPFTDDIELSERLRGRHGPFEMTIRVPKGVETTEGS